MSYVDIFQLKKEHKSSLLKYGTEKSISFIRVQYGKEEKE
jgi:hypothetical protein